MMEQETIIHISNLKKMLNYKRIKARKVSAEKQRKAELAKQLAESVTSDKIKKVDNEGGEAGATPPRKRAAAKKAAAKKVKSKRMATARKKADK